VHEKKVIAFSPGEDGRIGPPRALAHQDVSSDESVWIVADNLIIGAHILSEIATGLIKTFTLAMHSRSPVDEVYRQSVMTPHPLPGKQHHLNAQITAAEA
jgi:pyruvate/2-oxoglutarate dehydrogenase complex dihydrolipoamide dehydrogenase (E3) component